MTEQKNRLNIKSIAECNMDRDAEVGELFIDMRKSLGLEVPELAARLHTRPEIISALEDGNLAALPPWPQTSKIVNDYTKMLKLDPGPIMRRIALVLTPPQSPPPPATPQQRNTPMQPSPETVQSTPDVTPLKADARYEKLSSKPVPARKRRNVLGGLLWLVFLAGAAYIGWLAYQDPEIRTVMTTMLELAIGLAKSLVAEFS
jgi:cytoskeletal protein RodZ